MQEEIQNQKLINKELQNFIENNSIIEMKLI